MNEASLSPVDLDQPAACLCAALRRASRIVTQAYDGGLAACGLTGTQFTVLNRLAETGPVAIKTLAAGLGADRTTLSRTLRPLLARDLVRVREGEDRRVKRVALAPKGAALRARAEEEWRRVQQATVRELGAERAGELLGRLAALERAAGIAGQAVNGR